MTAAGEVTVDRVSQLVDLVVVELPEPDERDLDRLRLVLPPAERVRVVVMAGVQRRLGGVAAVAALARTPAATMTAAACTGAMFSPRDGSCQAPQGDHGFPVAHGLRGEPDTQPSSGPTPYGFDFAAGTLVVTEAFGGQ